MKKTVPLLLLILLILSACKLDTMLGYETVAPEALYTITVGPPPTSPPTVTPTRDPNVTVTPAPTLEPGSTRVSEVDGMTMVYIPAGVFEMGGHESADELPIHSVDLSAYWIDQNEVTCNQFMTFNAKTGIGGYAEQSCADGGDHPVRATWDAARAYCAWAGRRLPTEAEWEKAARGGLAGKQYPWGDEDPVCQQDVSNGAMFYDDDNCLVTGTAPVRSYAPNGFDLYDMAGNVSEWVSDWYGEDYYETFGEGETVVNPPGPASGAFRVHRGGSYRTDADGLRAADREGMPPQNFYGFRCAANWP